MEPAKARHELPPLILHPFDKRVDGDERSRVTGYETRTQQHLQARYDEFRMLCLIGKDLNRWLGQCAEMVSTDPVIAGLTESDFVTLLLFDPPVSVIQKMRVWGVKNYQIIFSRAIGLNAVFPHPPAASEVSESFLRKFHKYADALYDARLKSEDSSATLEQSFTFEIYASAEYSAYLANNWGE